MRKQNLKTYEVFLSIFFQMKLRYKRKPFRVLRTTKGLIKSVKISY